MNNWTRAGGAVRPPLGGAAVPLSFIDDMNEIRAASPDTVYALSAGQSSFETQSQTTNVYSDAKKIVCHLRRPLSIAASRPYVLFVMGSPITYNFADNVVTLSAQNLSYVIRLKAITADFDPTALTWNAYAGLTLESSYVESQSIFSAGAGFSTTVHTDLGGNNGIAIQRNLSSLAPLTVYGWVLEVKVVLGTSSKATLQFGSGAGTSKLEHFFAYNAAA